MSIGTTAAIGIGLGAAGIAGAGISAAGASSAANTQAQASNNAANLQFQLGQENLGFQEQQYANSLGLMEPFYQTGTESLGTLAQLMGMTPAQPNMGIFPGQGAGTNFPTLPGEQIPGATAIPGLSGGGVPFGENQFAGPQLAPGASPINPALLNEETVRPTSGSSPQFNLGNDAKLSLGGEPISSLSAGTPGGAASPGSTFQGAFRNPNMPQGGPVAHIGPPTSFNGPNGPITVNGSQPPATSAIPNVPGTQSPFGFLNQTFSQQFAPPNGLTEQNDPGYQARLALSENAIQNSAAARGNLLSGNTAEALDQFAQTDASQEYQNVYNRALQNYNTNFNVFNQNQANLFNRYAALAGIGQTSAGQLSNAGLTTGANVGNTLTNLGGQLGNDLTNAGAARASGIAGVTNSLSSATSGLGNLALLSQILGQGGSNPFAGIPGGASNPAISTNLFPDGPT